MNSIMGFSFCRHKFFSGKLVFSKFLKLYVGHHLNAIILELNKNLIRQNKCNYFDGAVSECLKSRNGALE